MKELISSYKLSIFAFTKTVLEHNTNTSIVIRYLTFFFRFSVNIGLVFGYYSFWHSVLYIFGWSERPFHPNRQYKLSKVAHNMWYTFLGVVQFTIWEVIYMYCCATKRIRYLSDQQVTSSYWNLVMFCLVAFWVPLYKDFHFYFTHR